MSDTPKIEDFVGIWKDAFPEGIDSVEIVRCNRNGWDYEDYIRLRDMGVDPEDIAATAKRIAELEAQVEALTKERDYWRTTTEDPGLYWADDNPPYRLWHDEDDDE